MMMNQSKIYAVVPAAGNGSRMSLDCPKQYVEVNGKCLLAHAVSALLGHADIVEVVIVLAVNDVLFNDELLSGLPARWRVVRQGGATRRDSVLAGIHALSLQDDDWIVVHDAARPFLLPSLLQKLIVAVGDDPVGGILALPIVDTVKRQDDEGRVDKTEDRDGLWLAQTPQMFRASLLRDSLAQYYNVTDESSAMEAGGYRPKLVQGDFRNIKMTYPSDWDVAELFLGPQR